MRSFGLAVLLLFVAGCFEAPADPGVAGLRLEAETRAAAGQRALRYRDLWAALEYTDEAPGDPAAVLLFYSGRVNAKADKVSQRLNPDHGPDSWNREHVWPRSRGFADEGALAHNDLHHVRAADVTCNADRGALDFAEGGASLTECRARRDRDGFEPDDAVKGDVARILFYMDVRYAGRDGGLDLRLVEGSGTPAAASLGDLCTLLAWHARDPVDAVEERRHQRIADVQGNRNPFIDEPELAARIFGSAC